MKKRFLVALAVAPLLGLACGDDDDDSTADAAEELCASAATLASTVGDVFRADVDAESTTIGDVKGAVDELESQVSDLEDAEDAVSEAVRDDLGEAFDTLRDSLEDISDDDTLAEAGAQVDAARTQFATAWESSLAELNCEQPTTT